MFYTHGYYDLVQKDVGDGSALKGTHGLMTTRRGRAGEALATRPRDGATGPHIMGRAHHRINKMLMGWVFDLSWSIDLFTH